MKVLISGQTDLSRELFDKFYTPKIQEFINKGASFMMGTASGADTFALELLRDKGVSADRIEVVFKKDIMPTLGAISVGGNFVSFPLRDSFMTQNTDVDIAFINGSYMSIGSGTMSNIFRREYGHEIATKLTSELRRFTDEVNLGEFNNEKLYEILQKICDDADEPKKLFDLIIGASMNQC